MSNASSMSSSNRPSMPIGIASNVLNSAASVSGKSNTPSASAQNSPTNTPLPAAPATGTAIALSTAPTAIVSPIPVSTLPPVLPTSSTPDYDLGIASGMNSNDDHDAIDSKFKLHLY